jgi:hypothetical protein
MPVYALLILLLSTTIAQQERKVSLPGRTLDRQLQAMTPAEFCTDDGLRAFEADLSTFWVDLNQYYFDTTASPLVYNAPCECPSMDPLTVSCGSEEIPAIVDNTALIEIFGSIQFDENLYPVRVERAFNFFPGPPHFKTYTFCEGSADLCECSEAITGTQCTSCAICPTQFGTPGTATIVNELLWFGSRDCSNVFTADLVECSGSGLARGRVSAWMVYYPFPFLAEKQVAVISNGFPMYPKSAPVVVPVPADDPTSFPTTAAVSAPTDSPGNVVPADDPTSFPTTAPVSALTDSPVGPEDDPTSSPTIVPVTRAPSSTTGSYVDFASALLLFDSILFFALLV